MQESVDPLREFVERGPGLLGAGPLRLGKTARPKRARQAEETPQGLSAESRQR
jgi:hypothetical protein